MKSATIRMGVVSNNLALSENIGKMLLKSINEEIAVELMTWAWAGGERSEFTTDDDAALGHLVFVDESVTDLELLLKLLSRKGRAVFLITKDGESIPHCYRAGTVDDVLVFPFRRAEVLTKLKFYHQILAWHEVQNLNESFTSLVQHLHEDLQVAELIQKRSLPIRFDQVKGFQVYSRYMAGAKPGGDFFDLADFDGGFHLLMSDSSSYGLSSSILSVLMKVASRVSREEARSGVELFKRIQEEVRSVLKYQDHLSLLFGTFSSIHWKFRYFSLGRIKAYYAPQGKPFELLENQGPVVTSRESLFRGGEREISLDPGSRLVLATDGFDEAAQNWGGLATILNDKRDLDPRDSVNELVFHIKNGFRSIDDVPDQDCTMLVFDADPKTLKLVS